MQEHEFSWDDVDAELRTRLAPGATGASGTVGELIRRFGPRPTERFVAERWPVLRDDWLVRDDAARAEVIAALRAARLGDLTIATGDLAADLAYLRSCRNQKTLRRVVLDAFLAAIARGRPPAKAGGGRSWDEFTTDLAAALASLAEDQCLVLSVRGTGVEGRPGSRGSSYYVQFVATDYGLRAEAVSNSFLVGAERISPEAQIRLVGLGWQPPTHPPGQEDVDPEGSPNYFHDHQAPVPFAEVASTAVATLRDVYGASEPATLTYLAFDASGRELEFPGLGVEHEASPANVVVNDPEELLPSPSTPAELRHEVETALSPVLTGGEVHYDRDGDIPIRFGSTQVFVRSGEEAPVVRVFAILLTDLSVSSALMDAVNDLNQRYLYAKFFWDGRSVVMAIDVPCRPFVGSHLLHAIGTVGQVGDELDEELQERFGGRTFWGLRVPEPDGGLSAGYL